jgi:DNA-directed RNA polymerase specialized sigma24 family protein
MKTNNYTGLDPHIVAVIGREVKKLIGRYGFTASDVPDIEQELHLKVWRSLKGLDEAILEAAVCQIVKHAMIDLLRRQERACRDWRVELFSTNAFASDADDPEDDLAHILDLEHELQSGFGLPPSWHKRRGEAADLADALVVLPDDLRELALALYRFGGNLSEAARSLAHSRKKARILMERLQREAASWSEDS